MPTKKEALIDEIIENARRDRKRLEMVADGLINDFKKITDDSSEEEIEQGVPEEFASAYAEEISKISDSLSRVNQQLVEIVKADRKSNPTAPDKLGKDDLEEALDEIQPQEVN